MHTLFLRVIVYGPFLVSLLGLLPKAKNIARSKLRDVLPQDKESSELREEVELTVELIARFERLIEVSAFDILYAYLNLLHSFWEVNWEVSNARPQTEVMLCIVLLLLYNALVFLLASRVYRDADEMAYPSLNEIRYRLMGRPISGRRHLTLISFAFATLAVFFTVISRILVTGVW
jgi:hypothetical protein